MNNANKDTAIKLLMDLLKSNMITIESEYTKGLYIFCITENITKFLNKEEGGQRSSMACIVTDKNNKIVKFHPLSVVSEEFEDEFIKQNNIKLCRLYYPPFNFKRTGCKGCSYSLDLQDQLDKMEDLLPAERKQCEIIWQPVYAEMRRIGYRLRKDGVGKQLHFDL